MPAANRQELEQLLAYLQTRMPYGRAVLFGSYAGARVRNKIGGYELLLLTADRPAKEGWQLEAAIERGRPFDPIEPRPPHIETRSMQAVNRIGSRSWFYSQIRDSGTIVYDNGLLPAFFEAEELRHDLRYAYYKKQYNYFFGAAATLLNESERMWQEKKAATAFLDLSYAGAFLLRTLESLFYGNNIHTNNLLILFKRVRYFSRRLTKAFPLDSAEDRGFFPALQALREAPFHNDTSLHLTRYGFYLHRLRDMQEIVRCSCARHFEYLYTGKSRSEVEAERLVREIGEELSGPPDVF